MYFAGNERFQKTKKEEDEQYAHKRFCNHVRFHRLRNFSNLEISTLKQPKPLFYYTCKTENKIHYYVQMKDRENQYGS